MKYLLDTDVFIGAYQNHYKFSFCPGFWDWIIQANGRGVVYSNVAVYGELMKRQDQLSRWAATHRSTVFLKPTTNDKVSHGLVSDWAIYSSSYSDEAKIKFLNKADSWLIAYARVGSYTVVTHERTAQERSNIKIPDAAKAHRVACMTPSKMLENEGVRLVI